MMIKRYAVDGSWVFCTSGIVWQKIKVSSQTTVRMHGCKAATLNDRVGGNMGGCPQMVGAAALVAALSASMLAMAATVFAATGIVLINYSICGLLTRPGMWMPPLVHQRVRHRKQNALMVEAQIPCVLGGMNTIINVGDMIMFAKFAQFSYYRADDNKQNKEKDFGDLIKEEINLKEVNPKDLRGDLWKEELWDNPDTGFHAKIFKDDLGRYVVAYRGTVTDNKDLRNKDIKTNEEQGRHQESEQYNNAMDLAKEINKEYPDDEVIFVGHSKGGGEAAAAGTVTGRPAYTYNSAGLSEETVGKYDKSLDDSKHIIALNSSGEILSSVQDGKIFIAAALSSIPFAGPWLAYNIARMPQAAGKRTSLVTDKTFNPFANHGLKPLWEAMEKKVENPQINVLAKKL